MQISQITNINSYEFKNVMKIYTDAFPSNEIRSVQETANMLLLNNNSYKLFAAQNNKKSTMLGFILVYDFIDFVLLDYMAIQKEQRGNGIGSVMFQWLIEKYKQTTSCDMILLEIQRVLEPDKKTKKARMQFYKRHGAKLITDSYHMPSYENMPSELMLLMGVLFSNEISELRIIDMVERIYEHVYDVTRPKLIMELKHNLKNNLLIKNGVT